MAKGHDHDHGEEVLEFSAKKPISAWLIELLAPKMSWVVSANDCQFIVAGIGGKQKSFMNIFMS